MASRWSGFAVVATLLLFAACGGSAPEGRAPVAREEVPVSFEERKALLDGLVEDATLSEIVYLVQSWGRQRVGVRTECHSLLRHAGVSYAQENGLTEVPDPACNNGLLHGLLYGYAESVGGVDAYINDAVPFCERFAAAGHRMDGCLHGVGHGVAILSDNDIQAALDTCDRLKNINGYEQCVGAVVMEFGEDRLSSLGWVVGHSEENSPQVLTIRESSVESVCDGRPLSCHSRYWMLLLPDRGSIRGDEDGTLSRESCARFKDEAAEACQVGFGEVAGLFWALFDLGEGYTLPPDSAEEAERAGELAVARCGTHTDLGTCLLGLLPFMTGSWHAAKHPYIPDFCSKVPREEYEQCDLAVRFAVGDGVIE